MWLSSFSSLTALPIGVRLPAGERAKTTSSSGAGATGSCPACLRSLHTRVGTLGRRHPIMHCLLQEPWTQPAHVMKDTRLAGEWGAQAGTWEKGQRREDLRVGISPLWYSNFPAVVTGSLGESESSWRRRRGHGSTRLCGWRMPPDFYLTCGLFSRSLQRTPRETLRTPRDNHSQRNTFQASNISPGSIQNWSLLCVALRISIALSVSCGQEWPQIPHVAKDNFWFSCIYFLSAEITGIYHNTLFMWFRGSIPGPQCTGQAFYQLLFLRRTSTERVSWVQGYASLQCCKDGLPDFSRNDPSVYTGFLLCPWAKWKPGFFLFPVLSGNWRTRHFPHALVGYLYLLEECLVLTLSRLFYTELFVF